MKIELFYSDWNGQQSKKPYHARPTQADIKEALANRSITKDGKTIIAIDDIIEVRQRVNGMIHNTYRDMYRILHT